LENYEKAIDLMEQLKNINPKCMMALTNLSLYHMKVGNIDTAEKYKSDATMLNFELLGDEAERKRRLEDLKQKKLNDMARRKSMFVQVLEMDSEDAMANNGMGEIEFEQGEFLVAQGYFEQAIKFNTKYSVAYLGLAKSLYFQNEKDESKLILEKGINIASKNGDLMPANEMQALLAKLII
jgi:tetratricopeptide (TPR) repeat protein